MTARWILDSDQAPQKKEAVANLRPEGAFSIDDDGTVNYLLKMDGVTKFSDNEPTEEEIQTELVRLQAEYASYQYARTRAFIYPLPGEQFDLLWHAIDDGTLDKTSDFYTKRFV